MKGPFFLLGAGFLRPGDQGRGQGRPAAGVQHERLQGLQREGALRVPQLSQDVPPEAARDPPEVVQAQVGGGVGGSGRIPGSGEEAEREEIQAAQDQEESCGRRWAR